MGARHTSSTGGHWEMSPEFREFLVAVYRALRAITRAMEKLLGLQSKQ